MIKRMIKYEIIKKKNKKKEIIIQKEKWGGYNRNTKQGINRKKIKLLYIDISICTK